MRLVTISLAVVLTMAATPLFAQSTVGFTDPDDLEALLSYRLPDWGYRIWDGTLIFSGQGHDGSTASNQNTGMLGSSVTFYRESEQRIWEIHGSANGSFNNRFIGTDTDSRSQKNLSGAALIRVDGKHYLGDSELYARMLGEAVLQYAEERDTVDDADEYARDQSWSFAPGLGLGRVRDVTAIIRAQRISERLLALGRPALTRQQVVDVAEVLATEFGYRVVYDRGDRRFWREVLDPLLDPDRPLNVYEIEYLEEVLLESIGQRFQGQYVEAGLSWSENERERVDRVFRRSKGAHLGAGWIRNLSLTQQVSIVGLVRGEAIDLQDQEFESWTGTLSLAYLLNVSDRNRLDVTAAVTGRYDEAVRSGVDDSVSRRFDSRLTVTDRFYVEDRVVIRPFATANWTTGSNSIGVADDPRVSWSYGLKIDYYFDRMLY